MRSLRRQDGFISEQASIGPVSGRISSLCLYAKVVTRTQWQAHEKIMNQVLTTQYSVSQSQQLQ
jgi:hypothetical protein